MEHVVQAQCPNCTRQLVAVSYDDKDGELTAVIACVNCDDTYLWPRLQRKALPPGPQ